MDCNEFRSMLDNYTNLTQSQRDELKAHVAQCAQCRAELEFFVAMIKNTSSLPVPPPPADLIDKVNARLDSEPKSTIGIDRIKEDIRRHSKRYATIAACLALGLAVGLNSGTIKTHLERTEDDGVISRTVVSGTAEPKAEPEQMEASAPTAPAQTEASANPKMPEIAEPAATAAPTRKPAARTAQQPLPTVKPRSTQQSGTKTTVSGAAVTTAPKTASRTQNSAVPVPTSKPVQSQASAEPETKTAENIPAAVTEAPEVQSDTPGNYILSRDSYHMPSQDTARNVPESEDTNAVAGYSLDGPGEIVAQSNGDAREVKRSGSSRIIVSREDAPKVADMITETGIEYEDGYFIASYDEFYALIGKIGAKGIQYDYSLNDVSGDEICFKLVSPS